MATDGRRGANQGFGSFYLKVGSDRIADDLERVEALRDGAAPEARIRVDADEAWSSAAAVHHVREL